jgi:hypothetical protein
VSTVNYQPPTVAIATGAIVPVNATDSNKFNARSPAGVHLVVDVVGYFRSATAPGAGLRIERHPTIDTVNTVNGSSANGVTAGVRGATIAGGGLPTGDTDPDFGGDAPNRVADAYGTVGGGFNNVAGDQLGSALDRAFATVAGGAVNSATGYGSFVGGGVGNVASGEVSAIAGGTGNSTAFSRSAVAGGEGNSATGYASFVAGGRFNTASGSHSLAAGFRALADQDFCALFGLWSSNTAMSCIGQSNIFRIGADHGFSIDYFSQRADGGGNRWVYIGDINAGRTLNAWNNAHLTDAGVWVNGSSSVHTKTDFASVDTEAVLDRVVAMPVTTWRYREGEAGIRHIGPMAEDFYAAFGVGYGPHTIADLDARGVALAAIQGLNAKLEDRMAKQEQALTERDARIAEQSRELARLHDAVETLLSRRH